jgi:hypothetical protein
MADTLCGFPDRDDVLVTYLYDDMDASARATFDAHLAICVRCRNELNDLRGVRDHLAQWAPPMPDARVVASQHEVRHQPDQPMPGRSGWREIPFWAEVAAAMLVLGVSAGIANLDVRYDAHGLSVRTGWSKGAPAAVAQNAGVARESGVAQDSGPANATAPWRTDLTALEQQLRAEMRAVNASNRSPAVATGADARGGLTDAELTARIRTMIEASEKRQQTELAFRVAEAYNNMRAQRNADLMKVDSVLGALKSDTNTELLRQRASINYLVTASQKQ